MERQDGAQTNDPAESTGGEVFPAVQLNLGLGERLLQRSGHLDGFVNWWLVILSPWLSFGRSSYRDRLTFSSEEESATRLNRAEQNRTEHN